MNKGDVFKTPTGDTIEVRRVQRESEWADIKVTQPHGANWTKRQPLVDGEFVFAATLVTTREEERLQSEIRREHYEAERDSWPTFDSVSAPANRDF